MKLLRGVCVVLSILMLASCNKIAERSDIYKSLKADADSIRIESEQRNAELTDICKAIDEIVAGLENIKEEERHLSLPMDELNEETSAKEVAGERLRTIVLSIDRYKKQVATLEKKLKSQPAQYQSVIKMLKEQLAEKDALYLALSQELGIKDAVIDSIRMVVASLESRGDSIQQELDEANEQLKSRDEQLKEQEQRLHEAYYVVGTQAELKKMGVLSKKRISAELTSKRFVKIDIQKNREIDLKIAPKVKIVSTHPKDSYSLEVSKFGGRVIKIKDPEAFWRQTRYLVVMIK